MKRQSTRLMMIIGLILAVGIACKSEPATPKTIKVGGIFDVTGATGHQGAHYADGASDYVAYINTQGGINGRQVELIAEDYAYNVSRAEELYEQMVEEHHVIAILGWGTGDTMALRPKITTDKIPFFSTSYDEDLTVVSESPYNFVLGVTYSDQMRIALRYIVDNWTDTSRKPRVAFFYNDTPFGKSPLQDGRDYAAAHGIEWVDEQIVDLSAEDATAQIQAVLDAGGADYGIIQETANAAATIVRSARQLDADIQFIALQWAVNESTIELAGQAAEGLLGTNPFATLQEDVPGIIELRNAVESLGKDMSDVSVDRSYLVGWTTAKVLLAGIEKAGENLTGESVRRALETMTPYDTGGVTSPLMFNSTQHKGALALRISQVKNGQWQAITDYIEVTP